MCVCVRERDYVSVCERSFSTLWVVMGGGNNAEAVLRADRGRVSRDKTHT